MLTLPLSSSNFQPHRHDYTRSVATISVSENARNIDEKEAWWRRVSGESLLRVPERY